MLWTFTSRAMTPRCSCCAQALGQSAVPLQYSYGLPSSFGAGKYKLMHQYKHWNSLKPQENGTTPLSKQLSQLWEDELSVQAWPSAHSYEGQDPEALLSAAYRSLLPLPELPHGGTLLLSVCQAFASIRNPLVLPRWLRESRAALTPPRCWLALLPTPHRHSSSALASRLTVIVMF